MLNRFIIVLSSLCLKLFRLSSEQLLKSFLISLLETVESQGYQGCVIYTVREREKETQQKQTFADERGLT